MPGCRRCRQPATISEREDRPDARSSTHRRRPRCARGVRHSDDLQRARASATGPAGPWLHDASVRLRFPAAEADRRLRTHGNDSLHAAAWPFRRRATGAAERLLPLRRRRTASVDRRHSGSRRSSAGAAPSGARCSRRSTSGSARAASSPMGRCATSTNGRRASSSSQEASDRRTPTRSRSASATKSMCSGCACEPGEILHADRHGAVIVPPDLARAVPTAAREIAAREARILEVARAPGCTAEKLVAVFAATRRDPLTLRFVRYDCPPGRRFAPARGDDSRR